MAFDDGFGDEHDDEHADDEPSAPLLPPDDRLWRHPSEVASVGLPGRTGGRVPEPHAAAPKQRSHWGSSFLSGTIGALLVIGMVTAVGGFRTREVPTPYVSNVVVGQEEATAPNARTLDPLVAVAARVQPSVVSVRAERTDGVLNCSGFVFATGGFILTSQRTVERAKRVMVTLSDASTHEAEVVGTDPDTGVAVLRIGTGSVTPVKMRTAATLRAGVTALTIGANQWVGVSVVAAVGRAVQSKDSPLLLDMIDLNVDVDPLASGGPVVDGTGSVIGVSDVLDGRGYATPIDIAKDVADQLIARGKVYYGYLGVEGGDADEAVAKNLGVEGGAVVHTVADGSPAYLAGVHPGDIIVRIESQQIATMAGLKYAVRSYRPGRAVTLHIFRDGKAMSINATLTERPVRQF